MTRLDIDQNHNNHPRRRASDFEPPEPPIERERENVTWKWITGVLVTTLMAISGWAWMSTADQIVKLSELSNARGERITRIEKDNEYLRQEVTSINRKLDQLLLRSDRESR